MTTFDKAKDVASRVDVAAMVPHEEVIESSTVHIDVVKWTKQSVEAEQLAKSILIVDEDSNVLAVDCLSKIKTLAKSVETERTATVIPFNILVTRINGIFKPISASLSGAEGVIKGKMVVYANEKETKRKAEEALLRLAAAQSEKAAQEAHRKAVAEAEAEALRTAKPVETPAYVAPAPFVATKQETVSQGYVGKTVLTSTWKGEVVDVKAICKAIADGLLPVEMVQFKPIELNKYAKEIGIEGVWSGIKVSEVQGIKAGRQ